MQSTIAFREYVHLADNLGLAFGGEREHLEAILPLLPHLSYFGRRGSFFQLLAPAATIETEGRTTPEGFTLLNGTVSESEEVRGQAPTAFHLGIIQRLDDWGPELTFAKANVYSKERIRLGRERVRQDVILPYQITCAGRGFTVYERIQ